MDGFLLQLKLQWAELIQILTIDPARLAEPDIIARLILQVLLLVGSAFFSGSETALFSLSRLDLQRLRKTHHPQADILHDLLDQPRRLIISILCGNELVNIAAAVNMTGILISLYGSQHAGWINILLMVPLLMMFGEVTPKTIAISNPVGISVQVVASPMNIWVKLVSPLRWVIRTLSDRITTWIVGAEKAAENILHVDEFRTLIEEVSEEGQIKSTERALIYNLLEAGDTEIVEIMTPRTQIDYLDANMDAEEMLQHFRRYQHSRVPVFRVHRDNLVGFLHAEDILRLILDDVDPHTLPTEQLMHPPIVVPLTKKVDEMFDFFQENKVRAAIVLNEFGGVEGFLTLTDVLTFIFGQISGEIQGEELYRVRDENIYEIPGDMKLTDFNNLTNFGLEDTRMTTIGGVAFRHLDRLPKVGDKVMVEEVIITILKMDAHRIAEVRVARGVAAEESVEETPVASEPAPEQTTDHAATDAISECVAPPQETATDSTSKPTGRD